MKFTSITASVGITGFESPAGDYLQLPLSLDELLVEHPSATFIGKADGHSMEGVGIFNGEFICKILNIEGVVIRSIRCHRVSYLLETSI